MTNATNENSISSGWFLGNEIGSLKAGRVSQAASRSLTLSGGDFNARMRDRSVRELSFKESAVRFMCLFTRLRGALHSYAATLPDQYHAGGTEDTIFVAYARLCFRLFLPISRRVLYPSIC